MLEAYKKVRIIASGVDSSFTREGGKRKKEERRWETEYFRDEDKIKVVRHHSTGRTSVSVATPRLTFLAERMKDNPKFSLRHLSTIEDDKNEMNYRHYYDDLTKGAMGLTAAYCLFDKPVSHFLSEPATKVLGITTETAKSKRLTRVSFELAPLPKHLKDDGFLRADGWLLLERDSFWAVNQFETTFRGSKDNPTVMITGSVEYGNQRMSIPVPSRVVLAHLAPDGRFRRDYITEIRSVEFGPIDDRDFTLEGCGIENISLPAATRRSQSWIFSGSIGVAIMAGVFLLVLRRLKYRKPLTGEFAKSGKLPEQDSNFQQSG
jgi:hypothetical protein